MPRIVNGQIVPDGAPNPNPPQNNNNNQAGGGFMDSLSGEVIVFGRPVPKQVLLGIGVGLFLLGYQQIALVFCVIVYLGMSPNPQNNNNGPGVQQPRTPQYATTTGTYSQDESAGPSAGPAPSGGGGGWFSSLLGPAPSQNSMRSQASSQGGIPQSRGVKKTGNIATLSS